MPLKNLQLAKHYGFETHMYYLSLDIPELYLERIAKRVASGGHHIPAHDVLRRIERSQNNLIKCLPYLDNLEIYNNSKSLELIGQLKNNKLLISATAPQWLKNIISTN
jgi:predicted ABC-type ATPase